MSFKRTQRKSMRKKSRIMRTWMSALVAGDYMLKRTWDTDPQPPRTLSSAIERANKNKEKHCKDAVSNFEKEILIISLPTKRRDVLNW